MIRVLYFVAYIIAFSLFYDRDWQEELFKVMKKDNFLVFFSRLGSFPQVFGMLRNGLCKNCMK